MSFIFSVKPSASENTENKTTLKICKITVLVPINDQYKAHLLIQPFSEALEVLNDIFVQAAVESPVHKTQPNNEVSTTTDYNSSGHENLKELIVEKKKKTDGWFQL